MPSPARAALITAVLAGALSAPAAAMTQNQEVDYLFKLGLLEGHMMVGHELLAANKPGLALPHFGHPVRELYDDIAGFVTEKRLAPFDTELIKLEAAVAGAPNTPETEALYQTALNSVHRARQAAPASIRASVPAMIKICADTIDAAAGEYGESLNRGRIDAIVEYHDSRGYISYAQQETDVLLKANPDPASQSTLGRLKDVLAKAKWIVDPLLPAATPRASVGQYRTVASEAAAIAAGK